MNSREERVHFHYQRTEIMLCTMEGRIYDENSTDKDICKCCCHRANLSFNQLKANILDPRSFRKRLLLDYITDTETLYWTQR